MGIWRRREEWDRSGRDCVSLSHTTPVKWSNYSSLTDETPVRGNILSLWFSPTRYIRINEMRSLSLSSYLGMVFWRLSRLYGYNPWFHPSFDPPSTLLRKIVIPLSVKTIDGQNSQYHLSQKRNWYLMIFEEV